MKKKATISASLFALGFVGAALLHPPQMASLGVYPPQGFGAVNPDITEATMSQTICNRNWSTSSIRPPTSYTTPLKMKLLALSGLLAASSTDYELDHLISLELGGAPRDPKNLWLEKWHISVNGEDLGAKAKDAVENWLHVQVCAENISLSEAQKEIATDWVAVYRKMKAVK